MGAGSRKKLAGYWDITSIRKYVHFGVRQPPDGHLHVIGHSNLGAHGQIQIIGVTSFVENLNWISTEISQLKWILMKFLDDQSAILPDSECPCPRSSRMCAGCTRNPSTECAETTGNRRPERPVLRCQTPPAKTKMPTPTPPPPTAPPTQTRLKR